MRLLPISFFILVFSCLSVGQPLRKDYQQKVAKLIVLFKENKKAQIAELVNYPIKREYPIPAIRNKEDFIARFDDVFDASIKQTIIQSDPMKDWDEVGYRGIMLHQGEIWIDTDGKIIAINYQSNLEKEKQKALVDADKEKLHPSLVNFKKPTYILETSKFRIRIDQLKDNTYRYAAWPISKGMNEKPDLILTKGEWLMEGSGGNHRIVFKNGVYKYECAVIVLGEEGAPPAMLTVYKEEKEILSQEAIIVGR